MLRLFAAALLLFSAAVHADPVKDSVQMELAFIKRVFETGYAPMKWKKDHLGLDLQSEYAKALTELNATSDLSAVAYRKIISSFLRSTQDYHVGVQFATTEASTLPFSVKGLNGRYFITWIEQEKVSAQSFPLKAGDELVSMNGRPVAQITAEIKAAIAHGTPGTDDRLSEMYLTKRSAGAGLECPQGPVELEFKRADGTIVKRQMAWTYRPETVSWNPSPDNFKLLASQNQIPKRSFLNPDMSWGLWTHYQSAQAIDQVLSNPYQIGGRKSYVPTLGAVLWESAATDVFHAYMFRHPNGKIVGYVRSPHYGMSTDQFKAFREVIRKFEGATDGLIIDQVNNPGGSVFYVLAMMSVLSKDPIKVPDHHVTLWPAMVQEISDLQAKLVKVTDDATARAAFNNQDNIGGFPVNYQFAQSALDYTRKALATWAAKKRMTEPLHLWGVDKVNPDPEVNYSKPILVLNNELDFSGGDFFPAILQDNNRAKVLGQRTAGAGGYVLGVEFPSALGLNGFSFTGSLARRVDDNPIENLGVTPDIPYEHTVRDYQSGMVDYKAAINNAIADLMR